MDIKGALTMNKGKILIIARCLLFLGIFLIVFAIFLENNDVASLLGLRAKQNTLEWSEITKRYEMEKLVKPINVVELTPEPIDYGEYATEEEKTAYEKEMAEYEEWKQQEEEIYETAMQEYEKAKLKYEYDEKIMQYQMIKDAAEIFAEREEIQEYITEKEININNTAGKLLLRFIGTIILLLGALGIFILGDIMEKLGLLLLFGFAFKTIIGL